MPEVSLACRPGSNPNTSGLKVLVMDREGPTEVTSALQEVPDLRVSTITPASVQLFQDVGAWDDIAPPRSAAFQHMQVALAFYHTCHTFILSGRSSKSSLSNS